MLPYKIIFVDTQQTYIKLLYLLEYYKARVMRAPFILCIFIYTKVGQNTLRIFISKNIVSREKYFK